MRLRSRIMLALYLIAFRILLRERGLSYWMSNGWKILRLGWSSSFQVPVLVCVGCVCVGAYVCVCECAGWFWEVSTLNCSTSSIINPNEPSSSCDSFLSLTRISCKQETSSLMLVDRWRRRMRMRMRKRSKAVASATATGLSSRTDYSPQYPLCTPAPAAVLAPAPALAPAQDVDRERAAPAPAPAAAAWQ